MGFLCASVPSGENCKKESAPTRFARRGTRACIVLCSAASGENTKKESAPTRFARRGTRLVPVVGVEPTRRCRQRILSPPRLPIPTYRLNIVIISQIGAGVKWYFTARSRDIFQGPRCCRGALLFRQREAASPAPPRRRKQMRAQALRSG